MRISLASRVARLCATATLIFSLGLSPSFARMGGAGGAHFARPALGFGHFQHFAPHGFSRRFEAGRFGNRFGPNRFDRFGFNRFNHSGFNHFGFNRFGFNRFGFNRFGADQLFVGGWGWGDWGGGIPGPTAAAEPIIVGGGAPVIINIGVDPSPGEPGGAYSGGCVIHKLMYDGNGKYVGERQIPQC
jgi:hypothetical protein